MAASRNHVMWLVALAVVSHGKPVNHVKPDINGAINPTFQISGQSVLPLLKKKQYLHVRADDMKNKQLTFCAIAEEIVLNDERTNDSCITQDIDMDARTAHRMSYNETTGSERQASFTLYLTCCETFVYRPKHDKTITYQRNEPEDRCIRIVEEDSWSADFILDVPDDCFQADIQVMAHTNNINDEPVLVSTIDTETCQKGEDRQCVYRESPSEKENIKHYEINITQAVTRELSERNLTVTLHRKNNDDMTYEEKLGILQVISGPVRGAFTIPGIHGDFVELVEDDTVTDAAYTPHAPVAQLTFCVNNLLGDVSLTLGGGDANKTSRNCITALFKLKLGRITLRYRESYRPCSDRHGVFYLQITRQPADKPQKLPVIPDEYPKRPDQQSVIRSRASSIKTSSNKTDIGLNDTHERAAVPGNETPAAFTISLPWLGVIAAATFICVVSALTYFCCDRGDQEQAVQVRLAAMMTPSDPVSPDTDREIVRYSILPGSIPDLAIGAASDQCEVIKSESVAHNQRKKTKKRTKKKASLGEKESEQGRQTVMPVKQPIASERQSRMSPIGRTADPPVASTIKGTRSPAPTS